MKYSVRGQSSKFLLAIGGDCIFDYSLYITQKLILICNTCLYQVLLINRAIDSAKAGSSLYELPHVADPSHEIVEVLIQYMDWNIASRQSGMPESELPELQQKAINLLDLLKKNLPDKTWERPSGILKRPIQFCTRSAKFCCGETRITPRVKLQR